MDTTIVGTWHYAGNNFEEQLKGILANFSGIVGIDTSTVSDRVREVSPIVSMFNEDGTVEMADGETGTWATDGDRLTLEYGDELMLTGTYRATGDSLALIYTREDLDPVLDALVALIAPNIPSTTIDAILPVILGQITTFEFRFTREEQQMTVVEPEPEPEPEPMELRERTGTIAAASGYPSAAGSVTLSETSDGKLTLSITGLNTGGAPDAWLALYTGPDIDWGRTDSLPDGAKGFRKVSGETSFSDTFTPDPGVDIDTYSHVILICRLVNMEVGVAALST